jgi:hypothetical protein
MADVGIPVTVGGVPGIGILDEVDEIVIHDAERGQVVVTMTTITVQTSAFPYVAIDSAVVAGSTTFSVRERIRVGDGGLTKLLLGSTTAQTTSGGAVLKSALFTGDGTTNVFTLPALPSGALGWFWNGEIQSVPYDYSIVGKVITMVLTPNSGDHLVALYT